jgi:peptidase S41-like protein
MRSLPLSLLVATACSSLAWSQEPTTSSPVAGDSSCVAALDSLQSIFRHDYPGYREKVAGHEKQLAALGDSVRAVARTSDSAEVCIPALRRWASFFKDPHVTGPWQSARPTAAQAPSSGTGQPTGQAINDPDRPSIKFLDGRTAALRLPSFDSTYTAVIDSLIHANGGRLRLTPYLIIDVRGNRGGYTGSYASVTPLLYTGPVHSHGSDVWASLANIAHYRELAKASYLSAADRRVFESFLSRAAGHTNEFVELVPDTIIRMDTVFPMPRRVAVLVDSGCASSCEDFLLEVRQSTKVTTMGTHSAGVWDYGEVRGIWLPGWRRVALPTKRTRGPRIDNVGIAPGVLIPSSEPDPVGLVRRYLARRRDQ